MTCSRAAARRAGRGPWERGRPGRPDCVAAPLRGAFLRAHTAAGAVRPSMSAVNGNFLHFLFL